jgi:GSKIP domain
VRLEIETREGTQLNVRVEVGGTQFVVESPAEFAGIFESLDALLNTCSTAYRDHFAGALFAKLQAL